MTSTAAVGPAQPAPWRDVLKKVLATAIPQRIAVFLGMWLTMVFFPMGPATRDLVAGGRPRPDNVFLDGWERWDAHWYWNIATHGYSNLGEQKDTAFFPLLPLLSRIVNVVVGDMFIAGMLVSNLALLGACYLLYRLVELKRSPEAANRALVLLLCYPFAFIFSAMYTESLFLLGAVAAFYFAETDRWHWAAVGAACAGTTRVAGVFVAAALVLVYAERIRFRWREVKPSASWLLLGFAGPAAHLMYLWVRFGDPLAFVKAQFAAGWAASSHVSQIQGVLSNALHAEPWLSGRIDMVALFAAVMPAVAIACCIYAGWRYRRASWALWGIATVLTSFAVWFALGRYTMVIFPMYLVGAELIGDRPLVGVAAMGMIANELLMYCFSHWRYIG